MILWSMALLDGWVTAMDVALLRVSGDGKVNDGLGRGKKERADVASYCRSELAVLCSEAETNAQTVPHHPPPSKSRYHAHRCSSSCPKPY